MSSRNFVSVPIASILLTRACNEHIVSNISEVSDCIWPVPFVIEFWAFIAHDFPFAAVCHRILGVYCTRFPVYFGLPRALPIVQATYISTMSAPTIMGLQVGMVLPEVCTQGAPTADNEDLCNEDLSVRLRARDMETAHNLRCSG